MSGASIGNEGSCLTCRLVNGYVLAYRSRNYLYGKQKADKHCPQTSHPKPCQCVVNPKTGTCAYKFIWFEGPTMCKNRRLNSQSSNCRSDFGQGETLQRTPIHCMIPPSQIRVQGDKLHFLNPKPSALNPESQTKATPP